MAESSAVIEPSIHGAEAWKPADAHRASCGVAFVATLRGTPDREIIDAGLSALLNLDHRGAFGADLGSGDGAGILTQIPDAFLRDVIPGELPPVGRYAIGMAFLPSDPDDARRVIAAFEELAASERIEVLAWRDVPVTPDLLGATARDSLPSLRHVVVVPRQDEGEAPLAGLELDRRAYRLRKRAEHELGLFFASLSSRTLTYKGMLTTTQLEPFFQDLSDPRYASEIALVHARFSTSTDASWAKAQPMRLGAHNGEFTSIRGNRDWMRGREGRLSASNVGDIAPLLPVCSPDGSDSMSFDEVLELLHLDGRSLPHAVAMLLPEAWENDPEMGPDRRAFYDYHAGVIEPWDGPASFNFTDGTLIGSILDRNAQRPARFWVTEDGLVVLASETGVLDVDPATVVRKGRVEPGRMFLVDTRQGRIVEDEEIKAFISTRRPYAQWLAEHEVVLDLVVDEFAQEDGRAGTEIGDGPSFDMAEGAAALFTRVKALHAQVTAPPLEIDSADRVSALRTAIGPEPNLLAEQAEHARKWVLELPVLSDLQVEAILADRAEGGTEPSDGVAGASSAVRAARIPAAFSLDGSEPGGQSHGGALRRALDELCASVDHAIEQGIEAVVLSDRTAHGDLAPVPSLLALTAVHRHLVESQRRGAVSLLLETADVASAHDIAVLLAFGAAAVNPYRLLDGADQDQVRVRLEELGRGICDHIFAFGTSTVGSYRASQGFEVLGFDAEVLARCFPGTPSRPGRHGLNEIATEIAGGIPSAGPAQFGSALRGGDGESGEAGDRLAFPTFTELNGHQPQVVRVCPHRWLGAVELTAATEIRIEFAGCSCESQLSPHHDAASLEDLAQLVYDLKNANPDASIHVVLAPQAGIGAFAAGAAKAYADGVIVGSDHSGPGESEWERNLSLLALAESHAELVRLGLRSRVVLGIDGVRPVASDILDACRRGAEYFGLTEPASDVDGLLAELDAAFVAEGAPRRARSVAEQRGQEHRLGSALDQQLITGSASALEHGERVALDAPVRNVNRAVGTLLGHEVTRRFGRAGLGSNAVVVTLTGSAGQSLGAFLPHGVTIRLFGDAGDFVGKGLCGGRVIVRPDTAAVLTGTSNVIAGNVIGYGASSGEVFLRGMAGDRLAVRNHGATFVVEGAGDRCCEDMTAGTVMILGQVGSRLATRLRGGEVFALDLHPGALGSGAPEPRTLTDDDAARVRELLTRHVEETGSMLAAELLETSDAIPTRFTKISPTGRGEFRTRDDGPRNPSDPIGSVGAA